MRKLLKKIDSVHHLIAFLESSQRGSFTEAAKALNVSQPAISQSVRKLEKALGVELFHRSHRKIRLTEAGEKLNHGVADGFRRINEAVNLVESQLPGKYVTLSVSSAFANYWMVPRLADFHHKFPNIDLRLQTTDKDIDINSEGLSLGIRRGRSQFSGYDSAVIANEILRPILSPGFAQRHRIVPDINALAILPKIHLEEPYRPRPNWTEWLKAKSTKATDLPRTDRSGGLRLNDYALVVQAAMAGEGIAIGWEHIVAPLVQQGLLQYFGDHKWETGAQFHLIWSQSRPLSRDAITVRDWIIETASKLL